MSPVRLAVQITLTATLTATTAFAAAMGVLIEVQGVGVVERVVGVLVVLTALAILGAGLDGSVLRGRVTARVPAWALHGALPVCGVGAVVLCLVGGTLSAGAVAGLLLLPGAAYLALGLVSGALLPQPETSPASRPRQRRGGRRRKQ